MPVSSKNPNGSPRKKAEIKLKARAVARGVAIGRAVCLHGRKRQFYRVALDESLIERETRRFRASVRLAKRQLVKIAGAPAARPHDSKHNIFETHLLFLEDASLLGQIEKMIRDEKVNAEWAVKVVIDHYIATYKAFSDEHLREKYIDLEDVADRLLTALGGGAKSGLKLEKDAIIIAKELKPSTLIELAASEPRAIITERGGWTSHTFILAREISLPAVTGMKGILRRVQPGDQLVVDGYRGQVILNPSKESLLEFSNAVTATEDEAEIGGRPAEGPLKTLDNVEVTVRANLDLPEGFARAKTNGTKGIGLYRSEFLFNQYKGFPSEAEQIKAYRKIARLAGEDGVRIRTFDLSVDQLAGESEEKETNPALGLRAIRLVLSRKREFRRQIRALLQASAEEKIDVVLPMISDVAEILHTKKIIEREKERLERKGAATGNPRLGAMIEVPSAVLVAADIAAEVDFLSLGTNDLVQYLLAVDRDNEAVADWFRTLHPAVLRAVKQVVEAAEKKAIPLIVCGEMAGSPVYVPILIGLGATELSMNVNSIARVRRVVSDIAFEEAREIADRLLECRTADEAEQTVREKYLEKWSHLFSIDVLPAAPPKRKKR